jgi:uncharacterized protein YbjT (DUF2867 family)
MIVILGASGKTGRVVVELVKRVSAVRLVARNVIHQPSGLEVARARLSDEVELARALKGAQALYAILPDDFRAEALHAERRVMAETMTRVIRREGVGRVVLVSSSAAVLGERGGNGFGADLAYLERLLSDTNAAVTILRPSYFQDNALMALPAAQHEGVYPNFFATRTSPITTIAARDVGKIAAAALLEPPRAHREIVDLVGPAYSAEQIAALLGQCIGRPLSLVDVPLMAQEQALRQYMTRDAARAMVETIECLSSGRIVLAGDRLERGATELGQVLQKALAPAAAHTIVEVQP